MAEAESFGNWAKRILGLDSKKKVLPSEEKIEVKEEVGIPVDQHNSSIGQGGPQSIEGRR